MPWYLDSSALAKLVTVEAESQVLRHVIPPALGDIATSSLSRVEVLRAAWRKGPNEVVAANLLLEQLDLIPMGDAILERAAGLQPSGLRALDAIHVATALALGRECDRLVTYDHRMQEAARLHGFTVEAPGQSL